MKRILMILDNYYPHIGGAELMFQNLAESLAQQGYTVTVLTPRSFPEYKSEEILNGVHIYRPWMPGFLQRYFFTFLAIPKAISLARQHDIIHTATFNAAFPAWIAAKVTGRKSLITIFEVWGRNWFRFGESRTLSAVLFLLERLVLLLKFDQHVSISDSTERAYAEVYPTRPTARIYPGVDYNELNQARQRDQHQLTAIRERWGFKPDDFVIASFGRTGLSKGFEYLVRAIPAASEQVPQARFAFVWPTAPNFVTSRDQLVDEISRFSPSVRVDVQDKKPRQELLSLIQAADCVVVPSLSEGFGYAVVESCCLCNKVIASNTTSIPEVVGGNYLLTKPASPEAIAQAIADMYQGRYASKALPTTFTVERMVDAHKAVYESL